MTATWTYAIEVGGVRVGEVTVRDAGHDEMAYIEWMVEPRYQRRGYAKTALVDMLPYLLGDNPGGRFHRLVAVIRPSNLASKGLAAAIGMTHEATARRARKFDGVWEDVEYHVILEDDL